MSVDVGAGFGEETDALGAGTFGGIAAVLIGGGDQECCVDILVFEFEFWLVMENLADQIGIAGLGGFCKDAAATGIGQCKAPLFPAR